jgi:hypothetical protein
MVPGGEFAAGLAAGRAAALELHAALGKDPRYLPGTPPELDIVVWTLAGSGRKQAGERSQAVFDAAAERHLHLALLKVPDPLAKAWWPKLAADSDMTAALRSVLMKPEHKGWLPKIRETLDASTSHVLSDR